MLLSKPSATDTEETPVPFRLLSARPKRAPPRDSMSRLDLLRFPSEKDQNGEAYPTGELNMGEKEFLSLPAKSSKYRGNQPLSERTPAGGPSDCPLETSDVQVQVSPLKIKRAPSEEECFFDLLSKFQSSRMDDQRCPMEESRKEATEEAAPAPTPDERGVSQSSSMASPQTEELFDLIASSQSRRLDDQRASVGNLPGLRLTPNNLGHLWMEGDSQEPGDEFFNMLMKCQSSRIDDQRCAPPNSVPRGPTVPDEDFFSLIQRVQAKRMDEQRVDLASADEEEEEEEEEQQQEQQVEETSTGSSAKAQL